MSSLAQPSLCARTAPSAPLQPIPTPTPPLPALPQFDVELPQKAWPGVCADGLNDAGLAASLQWQRDTNKVNAYSGAGPAVNQMDFVNWVLGTFSRAADVKAAIDKGLQVREPLPEVCRGALLNVRAGQLQLRLCSALQGHKRQGAAGAPCPVAETGDAPAARPHASTRHRDQHAPSTNTQPRGPDAVAVSVTPPGDME